jgi:FkbM family methyltransferase
MYVKQTRRMENNMYARKAPTILTKIIGKYKVPILPLTEITVVVDCGVGDGYFFWFYHSFFKNYIGVEASSTNVQVLEKKIKLSGSDETSKVLHNACYSIDDKELEIKTIIGNSVLGKGFTANNNSIYYEVGQKNSNWDNPIDENDIKTEVVKSITLDSIFSKFNLTKIDFLKVDIEDAEYDFLMNKNLSKIRFLAVEAPKPNKSKKSIELIDYICKQGFSKIFDNGKDYTFANNNDDLDKIYFVDFPTLYFSKMKTEFPFAEVELNCYRKSKNSNKRSLFYYLKKIIE